MIVLYNIISDGCKFFNDNSDCNPIIIRVKKQHPMALFFNALLLMYYFFLKSPTIFVQTFLQNSAVAAHAFLQNATVAAHAFLQNATTR